MNAQQGGGLNKFVGGGSNDCPGGSEWNDESKISLCK